MGREGFPHTYEDVSSGPEHPHKKLGVAICALVTLALCVGVWGQKDHCDCLAASLAPGSGETLSQGEDT